MRQQCATTKSPKERRCARHCLPLGSSRCLYAREYAAVVCIHLGHRRRHASLPAAAARLATAVAPLPTRTGETQLVETRHGPLAVTVCGDRSRTPCLTFPDVGLTHSTCWRGLLLALEGAKKSLLLRNFCFYHLDAPGCHVSIHACVQAWRRWRLPPVCPHPWAAPRHLLLAAAHRSTPPPNLRLQAPGATVPPAFQPLSLSKLAEAAADVAAHFKLREVLGMGAGVGGQVLLQLAAEQPKVGCGRGKVGVGVRSAYCMVQSYAMRCTRHSAAHAVLCISLGFVRLATHVPHLLTYAALAPLGPHCCGPQLPESCLLLGPCPSAPRAQPRLPPPRAAPACPHPAHLQLFCGLILISPSCRRPGWWEWGWGRIAARQLASRGWEDSTKQYLIQRMFGELLQQKVGGESDLLQASGWV